MPPSPSDAAEPNLEVPRAWLGRAASGPFCHGDCNWSPRKNQARHRMGEYRVALRGAGRASASPASTQRRANIVTRPSAARVSMRPPTALVPWAARGSKSNCRPRHGKINTSHKSPKHGRFKCASRCRARPACLWLHRLPTREAVVRQSTTTRGTEVCGATLLRPSGRSCPATHAERAPESASKVCLWGALQRPATWSDWWVLHSKLRRIPKPPNDRPRVRLGGRLDWRASTRVSNKWARSPKQGRRKIDRN